VLCGPEEDEVGFRGRVRLNTPTAGDLRDLLELARASRRLHRPWVYLSLSDASWRRYLLRTHRDDFVSYLLRRRDTDELVGVVSLSEIVRGVFQSAYLSFYAHVRHAGQGLMSEGVGAVIDRAFRVHRLHRVEANIQPGNRASLRLVRALGLRREGLSPKYLKIGGRWRDHERWALTRETWAGTSGIGRRRTPRVAQGGRADGRSGT
jgi:ribosomal-protein-alanine N-acetyltransferase